MTEKEWPKNSDSPTVQKALSIETLKAENAELRERLVEAVNLLHEAEALITFLASED